MKKKLLFFAFLCSLVLTSCDDIEHTQEIGIDLSGFTIVQDGEKVKVNGEAKCLMSLGTEVAIVILGDLSNTPCKWISSNTDVVKVNADKITAVGVGEAEVTDSNGSDIIIYVKVQKK